MRLNITYKVTGHGERQLDQMELILFGGLDDPIDKHLILILLRLAVKMVILVIGLGHKKQEERSICLHNQSVAIVYLHVSAPKTSILSSLVWIDRTAVKLYADKIVSFDVAFMLVCVYVLRRTTHEHRIGYEIRVMMLSSGGCGYGYMKKK